MLLFRNNIRSRVRSLTTLNTVRCESSTAHGIFQVYFYLFITAPFRLIKYGFSEPFFVSLVNCEFFKATILDYNTIDKIDQLFIFHRHKKIFVFDFFSFFFISKVKLNVKFFRSYLFGAMYCGHAVGHCMYKRYVPQL